MDQIIALLDHSLLEIGEYVLKVTNVIQFLLVNVLAFACFRLVKRLFKRNSRVKKIVANDELRRTMLQLVRSGIVLIALLASLKVLGLNLEKVLNFQLFEVPKAEAVTVFDLVMVVVIVLAARIGIWYFRRLFVRLGENKRIPIDQGRRQAIFQIFKYFVYVLAVIIILSSLKINLSIIVASSAALFVGIGLALQKTFADLAGGIMILFDGTIEVGDMVFVDSLKLEGTVKEIRLRTSTIETLDSVSVIVPNSNLTSNNVVNWDYNDRETRFKVKVSVAYGSDLSKVRKVLKGSAASHGKVMEKPEPRVRFVNFGDSGLEFEVLFWLEQVAEFEDIKSDIRFKIDAEFRRNEIVVPFPQRTFHFASETSKEKLKNPENKPTDQL